MDSEGASGCPWSTARATAPSPGQPTPGVVKQDKSSGGSVDTTKTRSGPQRVRMCSGERPMGAAKGKQSDTEALRQPPPPPPPDQRDPRAKQRNAPLGKSCWAIIGTQTFGPPNPFRPRLKRRPAPYPTPTVPLHRPDRPAPPQNQPISLRTSAGAGPPEAHHAHQRRGRAGAPNVHRMTPWRPVARHCHLLTSRRWQAAGMHWKGRDRRGG